jgi:hypothetical protein
MGEADLRQARNSVSVRWGGVRPTRSRSPTLPWKAPPLRSKARLLAIARPGHPPSRGRQCCACPLAL